MGNRIRTLLKKRGRGAAAELARQTNTVPATVTRWCSGVSAPAPELLPVIAKFLGVPVEDLEVREQKRRGVPASPGRINWPLVESRLAEKTLSISEFAKQVRAQRSALYQYRAGQVMPSSATLRRMARVLGLEPEELVIQEAADETPVKASKSNGGKRRVGRRRTE
jgi:transcriptional regulator with XRE-family HTH domain